MIETGTSDHLQIIGLEINEHRNSSRDSARDN
jgi:hypothetical protein